jgi:hypothetical protein
MKKCGTPMMTLILYGMLHKTILPEEGVLETTQGSYLVQWKFL